MSNPHDRFFKHTFNDPEKVLGTLEGALSPALFARLRLETLRPADTRYVDPQLKEYFSDLAYTCLTREDIPVCISFLFEHKSYHPHLQILEGLIGLENVAGGYAFFYTIFVYLLNGSKINFEKVMKSMYNLIPEEWVEM